jgi:hypothetical protein
VNGQSGFFPANYVKLSENAVYNQKLDIRLETNQSDGNQTPQESFPKDNDESDAGSNTAYGWHIVTTDTGQVYYWNEDTGETAWNLPNGGTNGTEPSNLPLTNGNLKERSLEVVTEHIEVVPAELIRKEGCLTYKIKKDFGRIEPKRSHSWHTGWGVICVGFLIFYKDEPAKLRKVQLFN